MAVKVRPADATDRSWIVELLTRRWGATAIVSRGRVHRADVLPALVAEDGTGRRGLATYRVEGDEAELVTLDAEPTGTGTGRALLAGVMETVRSQGCARLWLITTNDNLDAVAFYQRHGFRLVAVHRGAVDDARLLKPSIPVVGARGIPVHDELELAIDLE